jgi:hypothetical protein
MNPHDLVVLSTIKHKRVFHNWNNTVYVIP